MTTYAAHEIEQAVLAAMAEAGIAPASPLVLNGETHRCHIDGDRRGTKNLAYQIHVDNYPAGWFQNHRNGGVIKWKMGGVDLTPEEQDRLSHEIEAARQARAKEQKEIWSKAADFAQEASKAFKFAEDTHEYLQRKRVPVLGDMVAITGKELSDLRQEKLGLSTPLSEDDDTLELILPLRDASGVIWTLQRIRPDGQKRFLPGGKKGGTMYSIPAAQGRENGPVIICEGYATGASIHVATGFEVVCAMDCGNLKKVAASIRRKTDRVIYIAADNDVETEGNPGVTAAQEICRNIGAPVLIPDAIDGRGTDWNDVHVARGIEALRAEFLSAMGVSDQVRQEKRAVLPDDLSLLTDVYNARLMVERHGEDLRYCAAWRSNGWLAWDGIRWADEAQHLVTRMAVEAVEALIDVKETLQGDERDKLTRHVSRSLNKPALVAMKELARDLPGVPISPSKLDASPWLLNTKNCTLDLANRKTRKHKKEDLLTKMVDVPFDLNALCPTWDKFLLQVMGGDQELVSYLQRATGYSLTGQTTEHCLFVLYGTGRNGKSTFLNTLRAMMGDYARQATSDAFMIKRGGGSGASDEIAALRGARFVTAIETEDGQRMAEALVKQLTGGDSIMVRRLYENFFEYQPEFKLWLATNHKPRIRGNDNAIWRRIRLIPFTVTIPDDEVDPYLPSRLLEELPGILNWAVKGAFEWRERGTLGMPEAVKTATEEYRAEMDVIGRFLEECCLIHPSQKTCSTDLYERYEEWCNDSGERPFSAAVLSRKLSERGYEPKRSHGKRYICGITIKVDDSFEEENTITNGNEVLF